METTTNFNSFATPAFPTNLKVMEYVHGSYQNDTFKREVSKKTKSYLKYNQMEDIQVSCKRGIFKLTFVEKYNTTAKDILQKANSIEFTAFNMHHARIAHPVK
jgi:hypothetical protein